jgi:DNA-binding transcriptional LysR family regulator
MTLSLNSLDWTLLRSFLAVAETGSLTAAAMRLGQSQPTIGRHIKALETALGQELFHRVASGYELNDLGAGLVEPARQMAKASASFLNIAEGRDQTLKGTVRITASVVISHFVLPPILAQIQEHEPEIEIELVPSDTSENLIFREADIAIRMYRPEQLDIITKQVAEHPLALYAATELLAKHGQPHTIKDLCAMPFVGFDKSELILRIMRGFGAEIDRHFFKTRCDDQAAFWHLVCAGCGVGAMQTCVGDPDPRVERLDFQPNLPALPLWLAAPEALRSNARIRRVWDLLEAALGG